MVPSEPKPAPQLWSEQPSYRQPGHQGAMFAQLVNQSINIFRLWDSSGESIDNASLCDENAENEGNKSLNAVLMSRQSS